MSTEHYISEHQKVILRLSLYRRVKYGEGAGSLVYDRLIRRGWLKPDHTSDGTYYVITPVGRAVARQLGIEGGGA